MMASIRLTKSESLKTLFRKTQAYDMNSIIWSIRYPAYGMLHTISYISYVVKLQFIFENEKIAEMI